MGAGVSGGVSWGEEGSLPCFYSSRSVCGVFPFVTASLCFFLQQLLSGRVLRDSELSGNEVA